MCPITANWRQPNGGWYREVVDGRGRCQARPNPSLHPPRNLLLAPTPQGALAQLDTPHPVLYLHFPGGGRLKLFGDLVFPTTKHAVLRVGPGGVLCEDVLENMARGR